MTTLRLGSRGEDVRTLQRALNLIDDGIFGPLTQEAVKAFQKANGLTADGIVGVKTWGALPLGGSKGRPVRRIILHCTATPEGRDVDVATVRGWHKAQGWADIGYHWLIRLDGTIEKGRDESKAGAHTTGYNSDSIGIVYAGGVDAKGNPKDTRTPAQKAAMHALVARKLAEYPGATVHGHYEFAPKACPSFDVSKETW